jgi:hypothetical protein
VGPNHKSKGHKGRPAGHTLSQFRPRLDGYAPKSVYKSITCLKVGKKIHATQNLLENINAKMDSFTVATQNQLSFNNMLETQIQEISATILSQSNGDSSKTNIQESVRSIFNGFMEKAPKPTEGSLGGVGKDRKLSAAEKFLPKLSQRVKNALRHVLQSLRQPKSSGMEMVLLRDLKCDALAERINR